MLDITKKKISERKSESNPEEFIPYAAHYDENTLITKNGELIQVLKITGFAYETIDSENETANLRQFIRESIKNNFKDDKYAIWIHTIRTKRDLSVSGGYTNDFSRQLHNKWVKRNDWDDQYVNELYVSIITEGEDLSVINPVVFVESVFPKKLLEKRHKILNETAKRINEITENVLNDLQGYGAVRLGLEKTEEGYVSEILSFTSKIMNLKGHQVKLEPSDLSSILPTNTAFFQYNTVQIEGDEGSRYGALFSIKEYREVSINQIDKVLQLPMQFIVTECFDFINNAKAIEAFDEQREFYELSGSQTMMEISGIKEVINHNKKQPTDFGQHQILITIVEDKIRLLQDAVKTLSEMLKDIGIMFVREDLFMEDLYWSQLPGNFDFIRRQNYIPTARIGGYASLYNFPAGKLHNNRWGDAVTVFRTASNTPYFFNFHYEKSGHTMLIGPYGAGKTVLMNFLISEAQKFNARTFYFEKGRGSEIFIRAIGGNYYRVTHELDKGTLKINPLQLEDTIKNRQFLEEWFEYLIKYTGPKASEISFEEVHKSKIKAAVEKNFSLPKDKRNLSELVPMIWQEGEPEYQELKKSFGSGEYSKYFDNDSDNISIDKHDIVGFDISDIMESKSVIIPMISYLLHLAEVTSEGDAPEIIVLDEAWDIVDNPVFVPRLESWLDRLIKENAMVIFATESVKKAQESSITNNLLNNVKTQIYLPNKEAGEEYKDVFGLTEKELEAVKKAKGSDRQFVLKHNIDSVVCKLSLDGMNRELSVLSSDKAKLEAMEKAIIEKGESSQFWLQKYFETLAV